MLHFHQISDFVMKFDVHKSHTAQLCVPDLNFPEVPVSCLLCSCRYSVYQHLTLSILMLKRINSLSLLLVLSSSDPEFVLT